MIKIAIYTSGISLEFQTGELYLQCCFYSITDCKYQVAMKTLAMKIMQQHGKYIWHNI